MFLTIAIIISMAAWCYVIFVREWMVRKWPHKFSHWHNVEGELWARSRTILISRLYWVGGIIVLIHDQIHDLAASVGLDWQPLISEAESFVPPKYRGLVLAATWVVTGLGFEWLRRVTTTPVGVKE